MTPMDRLDRLNSEKVSGCTRCALHKLRTNTVFGEGSPTADVMFVGEGPGAREDVLGRPFVGDAGVILNNLIKHAGLVREEVYIANVVKCRPPGNRDPERVEIETCTPYLRGQIATIRPNLLVALGRISGNMLTGQQVALSGEVLQSRMWTYTHEELGLAIPVVCLYHPAYLHRKLGSDALKPLYRDTVGRLRRAIAQTKPLEIDFDF